MPERISDADSKYASPLVITLKMDQISYQRLNSWRERYFPPIRNYLTAHLTLYHHLPSEHVNWIKSEIAALCSQRSPFPMNFKGLECSGSFVGILVDAPEILKIKEHLNQVFANFLKAQDRQKIRPHVTLVNKVSPEEARKSQEEIALEFSPWSGRAEGIEIHFYQHGPWSFHSEVLFCNYPSIL